MTTAQKKKVEKIISKLIDIQSELYSLSDKIKTDDKELVLDGAFFLDEPIQKLEQVNS